MKSSILLIVDDEKVGPILRLLNKLGEHDARVNPIEEVPRLKGPASQRDPAKKMKGKAANQNPRKTPRGTLRARLLDFMSQQLPEPVTAGQVAQETGYTPKQVANLMSALSKQGRVERVAPSTYKAVSNG